MEFELAYFGGQADEQQIDFYDVAQGLLGFQRSLALTTHLILNGEVITQAPALRGAQILAPLPEPGSWKFMAQIVFIGGALYKLGTALHDTPLGNLVSSAYDYVISETLGFHVDYNKTLGRQYDELRQHSEIKKIPESKFDALIEKNEVAIRDMHRPIVWSGTANGAKITYSYGKVRTSIRATLTSETFEYLSYSEKAPEAEKLSGSVSSYNLNTYKGRIYILDEYRPIPFELDVKVRDAGTISTITGSLNDNASGSAGIIEFVGYKYFSRTGRLKRVRIVEISHTTTLESEHI